MWTGVMRNAAWPGRGVSWMMQRAHANGVEFVQDVYESYSFIDDKYALDAVHESWQPIWGAALSREAATGCMVGKRAVTRPTHLPSYRPRNLPASFPASSSEIVVGSDCRT